MPLQPGLNGEVARPLIAFGRLKLKHFRSLLVLPFRRKTTNRLRAIETSRREREALMGVQSQDN